MSLELLLEQQSDINLVEFYRKRLLQLHKGEKTVNLFTKRESINLGRKGLLRYRSNIDHRYILTTKTIRLLNEGYVNVLEE